MTPFEQVIQSTLNRQRQQEQREERDRRDRTNGLWQQVTSHVHSYMTGDPLPNALIGLEREIRGDRFFLTSPDNAEGEDWESDPITVSIPVDQVENFSSTPWHISHGGNEVVVAEKEDNEARQIVRNGQAVMDAFTKVIRSNQ